VGDFDESRECLFCAIVAGQIPATVVLDTDEVLAFRDIAPKAPVHVLVIPKKHYRNLATLTEADPTLAGRVFGVAARVAEQEGVAESGYRAIVNTGPDSGMEVAHMHVHVLGGAPLGPMLAR
jgi:histidine triad (HIT) family protein